jgi:ABC-type multidrug transport system ATPase subunit
VQSGLDSESALALVNYLHNYARGKDTKTGRLRRVILTIHQPSSQIWESIDNVILLAEGRLMYQGPRREIPDFFAAFGHPVPLNYNTADHAIEVLSKMPKLLPDEGTTPPPDASKAQLWNKCFEKWDDLNRTQQNEASDASAFRRTMLQRDKSCVFREGIDSDDDSTLVEHKLKLEARKSIRTAIELTRRSFTSLFLNPVVLGFRIAVYTAMVSIYRFIPHFYCLSNVFCLTPSCVLLL